MKKNILIHGLPDRDFYDKLNKRKDVKKIYLTEFRPSLLGASQVAKELLKRKIKPILICDNMVGFCLEKKMIDEIHLFAKSANQEGALCFIGSMIYAICSIQNKAKVFVNKAAKLRKSFSNNDVLKFLGKSSSTRGVKGYCPTWELVPQELIFKADL